MTENISFIEMNYEEQDDRLTIWEQGARIAQRQDWEREQLKLFNIDYIDKSTVQ